MKITEFFMRRPVLFWSLMVAILIAGVLSFVQMPKLEDPAVSVKQAMVVVSWPGASAHEMELEVAQLMEDELRALPNVKKVRSECQNSMALFTVEFQMTVLNRDLEQHFDLLRRKVNDAASRLPQGCYEPIVIDDMMDVYGIFYALTADGYDYPEMYRYARYLQRELLDVKGVKRINIVGNRDEVINIILSKEQIARNGIIPTQIMSALQSAGKTVKAGHYGSDGDRIALYVDSSVKDEEDIRNLQIQTLDGKILRIGDVARVERGYASPQRNGFFVDGKPALAICIAMESSAIVPDVGRAVDARLAEGHEEFAGRLCYRQDILPARQGRRGHLVVHVESGRVGSLSSFWCSSSRWGGAAGSSSASAWCLRCASRSPSCSCAVPRCSAFRLGLSLWRWVCWSTMPW